MTHVVGTWALWALCALGLWTLVYAGLCGVLVWRYSVHRKPAAELQPVPRDVLVMRPCKGDEPQLHDALMSGVVLRTVAPRALLHLVEHGDAAEPIARRAAQMLQTLGLAARVQMTSPDAINHKACQLASQDAAATHSGATICIDSDVTLMPDTLAALCAPLVQDARCGAAWLPFVQTGASLTWGDGVNDAILAASLQSFGVLRHIDADYLVGKLVAIRPQALRDAGGWQSVEHVLGEDTALSLRLRAAGWGVQCAEGLGYTAACARPLGKVLERYARWATVMRLHRPRVFVCYPLVVCPMPVLLASWLSVVVTNAAGGASRPLAALCVIVVGGARAAICVVGRRSAHMPIAPLRELCFAVLADAVLLAAFALAAVRRSLVWRGRLLRMRGRGRAMGWDVGA